MRLRPSKGKATALVVSLTLAGLLAALWANRTALRLEWRRHQAVRDCLQRGFDVRNPTPIWREILDSGEEGFPCLARLLKDRRWFEVARMAWEAVDAHWKEEKRLRFVDYLRRQDPCALISYLLPEPYQHGMDWRSEGSGFSYEYWSGLDGQPLASSEAAIGLCEDFLRSKMPATDPASDFEYLALKCRALSALAAMIGKDDLDRFGGEGQRAGALPARIVRLLVQAAGGDEKPEVRLQALDALASNTAGSTCYFPQLWQWEDFSLELKSPGPLPRSSQVFQDTACLTALAYLDHPRVLLVLARLYRRAELREKVEEVLSENTVRLPLPFPRWLPFCDRARRFLRGSVEERAFAAVYFLEADQEEGARALAELLERESNPELKLLERACLLVLGKGEDREALRRECRRRLALPTARHEEALILLPRWVKWNRWGIVQGWRRQFKLPALDLAAVLLQTGDREVLESLVVQGLSARGLSQLEFLLGQFVEDLDFHRLLDSDGLRGWWRKNKDRLVWVPSRRLFVVRDH